MRNVWHSRRVLWHLRDGVIYLYLGNCPGIIVGTCGYIINASWPSSASNWTCPPLNCLESRLGVFVNAARPKSPLSSHCDAPPGLPIVTLGATAGPCWHGTETTPALPCSRSTAVSLSSFTACPRRPPPKPPFCEAACLFYTSRIGMRRFCVLLTFTFCVCLVVSFTYYWRDSMKEEEGKKRDDGACRFANCRCVFMQRLLTVNLKIESNCVQLKVEAFVQRVF